MSVTSDSFEVIIDWLRTQRWYGDKSRSLDSYSFGSLGTVDVASSRVELLTVDCGFGDGGSSSYFVPIELEASGRIRVDSIVDAFEMSEFRDWFVDGFGHGRVVPGAGRTTRWVWGRGAEAVSGRAGDARLLRSEQSNTSILCGDRAIAKVFRRLQPGPNPDVEIIKYLTEETDFRHVPRHVGTVVIESDHADDRVTLAAVQGFIANRGDGWTWLLHELEGEPERSWSHLSESIELLGTRTAELHLALASPTVDTAFSAEVMGPREFDSLVRRLIEELDETISSLLASKVRTQSALGELRKGVARKVATVHPLVGFPKIRIHGDYHLGQVLRTTSDFAIIDFEGEPSRSMAQRREKSSPLKDVAGMLRSLDYAVATCERAEGELTGTTIREWGVRASEAFLKGYTMSIRTSHRTIVPTEGHDLEAALDFFMIEKALYEVRYELDNRPEWLEIPLRALETIASRP